MSQKHRLVSNSLSILANRLTQGVTTFVLSAAIARTLGEYSLGQYVLAVSYYGIFVSITSQGFKTLFTREIARDPQATPVYLVNGTFLQLLFSLIGYVIMVLIIFLLPYSDETSSICYVVGLTIIPFSLSNITESIFQAKEKMHLIACSTVPIYILRLVAMLWAIQATNDIKYVAIILVTSESIVLGIEWMLLVRIVQPQWQIDRKFIWDTIASAKTLFAIEGIGMISAKIDILILSLLGSEALVGLYGSVMQLLQPFAIACNSLNLAAFPGMSKAVDLGKDRQRQAAENIISVLLCIGIPFLIGISCYGSELLLFIYHKPVFGQVAIILNLVSVAMVGSIFAQTFSYVLIANGLEKFNLIETIVTTGVGSLSGIFLISQYKLLGAALTILTMTVTNVSVLGFAVYRHIFSLRLWKVLRLPLLISSLMSIVFFILIQNNLSLLPSITLSVISYTSFSSAIAVRELGGLNYVKQKISHFK
jgi:O-antigen/teichoic acid export membrane protein